MALDLLDAHGQPVRQRHPAGRDAEQDDVGGAVGPLQDLVRDPGERPPTSAGSKTDFRPSALDPSIPAPSALPRPAPSPGPPGPSPGPPAAPVAEPGSEPS